ncbi:glycosyltransferase family 4 protein [Deinococcus aquiradiocola]|nr:glycosyltransferase family 4 protein [Deinococcus aquiradiocola]
MTDVSPLSRRAAPTALPALPVRPAAHVTPAAPLRHVLLIGNHAPRQCGIATFTADVARALPVERVSVVAMNDGHTYPYPPEVVFAIEQDALDEYVSGAERINALRPDVVCVQHEYGIYGGPAGAYLLTLLRGLDAPIVTTLHTVLETPSAEQRAVLEELCALSAGIVVMSARAVDILVRQGVPRGRVRLIHHGVPDLTGDPATEKARLGVGERPLILTFGLIGRGKGLDTAVRALPDVVRAHPDALYLILGATHPHVLRHEGEAYREELLALARELGVQDNLRMDNRFVELDDLKRYLTAADVYLTPYPNPAQITSGTLAYAVGNGKAVVSTPYWYAEELLADGRGVLTPFGEPRAMGEALSALLSDPHARAGMGARAEVFGEAMRWPAVGAAYAEVFGQVQPRRHGRMGRRAARPAQVQLTHLHAMTDGTGLFQHATGAVPNPHEGYTTDDNARALQLVCRLPVSAAHLALARRYLSFLHYAIDEGSGVFRNFLSYDRRWLEARGAENAQARAVRALVVAALHPEPLVSDAARELLRRSGRAGLGLESPRAQAILLLAVSDLHRSPALLAEHGALLDAARGYALTLASLHAASARPGWNWFEGYLSYANAELPHALIAFGQASGDTGSLTLGLSTLDWLHGQQRGPLGGPDGWTFWPVGCERVYFRGEARPLWDGQPIEAAVSVAAYAAAYAAGAGEAWLQRAARALDWLTGDNLLGQPMLDAVTAGCRDGLHRHGPSINQGAESTVLLWDAVLDLQVAAAQGERGGPTPLSADD